MTDPVTPSFGAPVSSTPVAPPVKKAPDPAPVKVEPPSLAKYAGGSTFTYYTDKDVSNYVADLGKLASELGFTVGAPHTFGLGLDIYDPVSGHIIAVVRPRRRDLGVPEIILNLDQVRAAVAGARTYRVNEDRANGIVTPAEVALRAKQAADAKVAAAADAKLAASPAKVA
jgi:hypothetical protein